MTTSQPQETKVPLNTMAVFKTANQTGSMYWFGQDDIFQKKYQPAVNLKDLQVNTHKYM